MDFQHFRAGHSGVHPIGDAGVAKGSDLVDMGSVFSVCSLAYTETSETSETSRKGQKGQVAARIRPMCNLER